MTSSLLPNSRIDRDGPHQEDGELQLSEPDDFPADPYAIAHQDTQPTNLLLNHPNNHHSIQVHENRANSTTTTPDQCSHFTVPPVAPSTTTTTTAPSHDASVHHHPYADWSVPLHFPMPIPQGSGSNLGSMSDPDEEDGEIPESCSPYLLPTAPTIPDISIPHPTSAATFHPNPPAPPPGASPHSTSSSGELLPSHMSTLARGDPHGAHSLLLSPTGIRKPHPTPHDQPSILVKSDDNGDEDFVVVPVPYAKTGPSRDTTAQDRTVTPSKQTVCLEKHNNRLPHDQDTANAPMHTLDLDESVSGDFDHQSDLKSNARHSASIDSSLEGGSSKASKSTYDGPRDATSNDMDQEKHENFGDVRHDCIDQFSHGDYDSFTLDPGKQSTWTTRIPEMSVHTGFVPAVNCAPTVLGRIPVHQPFYPQVVGPPFTPFMTPLPAFSLAPTQAIPDIFKTPSLAGQYPHQSQELQNLPQFTPGIMGHLPLQSPHHTQNFFQFCNPVHDATVGPDPGTRQNTSMLTPENEHQIPVKCSSESHHLRACPTLHQDLEEGSCEPSIDSPRQSGSDHLALPLSVDQNVESQSGGIKDGNGGYRHPLSRDTYLDDDLRHRTSHRKPSSKTDESRRIDEYNRAELFGNDRDELRKVSMGRRSQTSNVDGDVTQWSTGSFQTQDANSRQKNGMNPPRSPLHVRRRTDLEAMKIAALKSIKQRAAPLTKRSCSNSTPSHVDTIVFSHDEEDTDDEDDDHSTDSSPSGDHFSSFETSAGGGSFVNADDLNDCRNVRTDLPICATASERASNDKTSQKRKELEELRRQVQLKEEELVIKALQSGVHSRILLREGTGRGESNPTHIEPTHGNPIKAADPPKRDLNQILKEKGELMQKIATLENMKRKKQVTSVTTVAENRGTTIDLELRVQAQNAELDCEGKFCEAGAVTLIQCPRQEEKSVMVLPDKNELIEKIATLENMKRKKQVTNIRAVTENQGTSTDPESGMRTQNDQVESKGKSCEAGAVAISQYPRHAENTVMVLSDKKTKLSQDPETLHTPNQRTKRLRFCSEYGREDLPAQEQMRRKPKELSHGAQFSSTVGNSALANSGDFISGKGSAGGGRCFNEEVSEPPRVRHEDELKRKSEELFEANKRLRSLNEVRMLLTNAEVDYARASAKLDASRENVKTCRERLLAAVAEEERLAEEAQKLGLVAEKMRRSWLREVRESDAESEESRSVPDNAVHEAALNSQLGHVQSLSETQSGSTAMHDANGLSESTFGSVLVHSPYTPNSTGQYLSPLLSIPFYALQASRYGMKAKLYNPNIFSVLSLQHLVPDKVLCKYSLHGRCSNKSCRDVHLDNLPSVANWRQALSDLVQLFLTKCCRVQSVSPETLTRALEDQVRVAQNSIESGADVEGTLQSLISSISPLCAAFCDTD